MTRGNEDPASKPCCSPLQHVKLIEERGDKRNLNNGKHFRFPKFLSSWSCAQSGRDLLRVCQRWLSQCCNHQGWTFTSFTNSESDQSSCCPIVRADCWHGWIFFWKSFVLESCLWKCDHLCSARNLNWQILNFKAIFCSKSNYFIRAHSAKEYPPMNVGRWAANFNMVCPESQYLNGVKGGSDRGQFITSFKYVIFTFPSLPARLQPICNITLIFQNSKLYRYILVIWNEQKKANI